MVSSRVLSPTRGETTVCSDKTGFATVPPRSWTLGWHEAYLPRVPAEDLFIQLYNNNLGGLAPAVLRPLSCLGVLSR